MSIVVHLTYLVAGVEGLEGDCETLFSAVLRQVGRVVRPPTHGAIPGAHKGVGDHERDIVRVGPTAALDGQCHMRVRHRVVTYADL